MAKKNNSNKTSKNKVSKNSSYIKKPTQNSQINLTRKSLSKSDQFDEMLLPPTLNEDEEDLTLQKSKLKDLNDDPVVIDDVDDNALPVLTKDHPEVGEDEEQLLDNIIGDWSGIDNLPPEH